MGAKPVTHTLDIYSAVVHLATTQKQWDRLRKTVDSLDAEPGGLGFTSCDVFEATDGGTVPHLSIFIDRKAHADSVSALVNTCAHEAAHAAGMLLNHLGQPYDGNSEAHAYLVGWLAQWLWDHAA